MRIMVGDALALLRSLPAESVHCCVTSPPYYGLRDYGVAGQMGLEASPDEFINRLVEVFREVRRVLRADGTAWVNMGDSYAGSRGGGAPSQSSTLAGNGHVGGGPKLRSMTDSRRRDNEPIPCSDYAVPGLKPKDLMGMPWALAFALRADGWWLRQDIVWSKPNPMPESVRDRCTKAHEYLFLLSKSERYYYDADAVAEPVACGRLPGNVRPAKGQAAYEAGDDLHRTKAGLLAYADGVRESGASNARNRRSVWTVATAPFSEAHFATFPPALIEPCILAGCPPGGVVLDPFGGAGTTGLVADRRGRNAILIEINPAYVEIARRRITKESPLFAEVA